MNGFKIWALQDLSHMLPAKCLQHETHVSASMIKRHCWSLCNSSRKEKNAHESRRINLSKLSNGVKSIFTTQTTSSEILTIILSTRSPTHFLNFETCTKTNHPKALIDVNSGDDYFILIHSDRNVVTNKVYGDCASKTVSTLQEPVIDDTIEQVRTDNLSTVIAARNVDSLPFVKSESKTLEVNQQRLRDHFKLPDEQHLQEYDISSQSPQLQGYMYKDFVSNMTHRLQQQSQITRCILHTLAIISKPLSPSFEILEQPNMTKRWQECTKDTTEPSAIFAKIDIPRNIPLKWSSTKQQCPCREYYTWKIPGIENDTKCNFFTSDTRTMQQSTCHGLSRFDGLTYFGRLGNQGFRNPSSCSSSVPRRDFSSTSCITTQSPVGKIETSRKDFLSFIHLKSTQETHPGFVSQLQSFSCDASKKSSKKNDGFKSQKLERKAKNEDEEKCEKTRSQQKDGRDSCVSSENETCKKRRKSESKSCERYICPELQIRRCIWELEPEEAQKCSAKERAATKDYAQSKDSSCSQKQDLDKRCRESKAAYFHIFPIFCSHISVIILFNFLSKIYFLNSPICQSSGQQSKSCTQRKDSEESSCASKDSSKRKNDCSKSKSDKKYTKPEKEWSKCTSGNHQKRSENRTSNSSRSSDKNKIDGKRRYSQQSIFSVSRDHRSFSTLIPDIVLGTDVKKTTKAFYSSCDKNEKDLKRELSCEEQKRKCETMKKDETKRKCVKGPAKCLSRKSIIDKMQTCESTQKDTQKDEKLREPTKKSCSHAEYCSNRKLGSTEPITKVEKKLKEKSAKEEPSTTKKDKKPIEESIKEQIDREYKEIEECKKIKEKEKKEKKEKKDETTKKICTEYKPTGLDRVISPCKEQEMKDTSKKFTSTPNEPIFSNFMDTPYKMLSIRSSIINDEIPFIPNYRDIKLLNVMFDRSFSTTKVSYQDDFAIKQTTGHSKTVQNCSANNSDFIHGDELPNYIEIDNDDEEEDEYDWIVGRPTF
ncbi:uncharacterized protein [Anoplolepis gracilipes]|uniref:uncharacterized protein n=1 Tax=Anoplolepis gracilipes TaxID=354296 RepID=UPI003BA30F2C